MEEGREGEGKGEGGRERGTNVLFFINNILGSCI
jgi:hypothetical protein